MTDVKDVLALRLAKVAHVVRTWHNRVFVTGNLVECDDCRKVARLDKTGRKLVVNRTKIDPSEF